MSAANLESLAVALEEAEKASMELAESAGNANPSRLKRLVAARARSLFTAISACKALPPAEREPFRKRIESIARLDAAITEALAGRRSGLASQIARLRSGQQVLRTRML